MKRVTVSGLAVIMDVSDNFDRQEVQEHLDLMNLNLQRDAIATGQIMGIDNVEDSDIEVDEEIPDGD